MILGVEGPLGGFLLRVYQVIIESSFYLLIGFLVAGALRAMAGPGRLRGLFGTGRWSGPIRSWVVATLLPVCALGVLPVLRELRRAGVGRPAILTFALAAPVLNPITLVYGISYLGPSILAVVILGTFVVSVGVGIFWGYLRPEDCVDGFAEDSRSVPSVGLRRLAAAGVHAAREATGASMSHVAAGLVGAGVVAALFSPSSMADSLFDGDPLAIPRMAAFAPLSYISPEKGYTIIPEMLKFRQSAGAMFVMIALGVGMTLGHLTWIAKSYDVRSAALWFASALITTLAVSYAVAVLLPTVGTINPDNDHFNELTNSFDGHRGLAGLSEVLNRSVEQTGTLRWASCGAMVALIAAGLALRASGERGTFEAYLAPTHAGGGGASEGPAPAWDRPLPTHVVSAFASCGVLAVAVIGAYAYFPSPSETFADMGIIRADFYGELNAPSIATPLHHLDLWDRQVEKLPTGALIRLDAPNPEARRRTDELREGLRSLRRAIERGRPDEARAIFNQVGKTYQHCRDAYHVP